MENIGNTFFYPAIWYECRTRQKF